MEYAGVVMLLALLMFLLGVMVTTIDKKPKPKPIERRNTHDPGN